MKPVRIYDLKGLTEEELAVVMAKCARSPEAFDEIAKTVTEEGAGQFVDKYVIGYGHASVAEIAVPNFAFEGVSILASKMLESMPRGAYQEKSTRAQNFLFKDEDGRYTAYYIPPSLEGAHRTTYIRAMEDLFSAYEEMLPLLQEHIFEQMGTDKFVAQRRAFDAARYLLPIGTQTNLGMRINGRDLAILISKLLSSPFEEFRHLGKRLHHEATSQLPTLVRYADANAFLHAQGEIGARFAADLKHSDMVPPGCEDRNYCYLAEVPTEHEAIKAVVRAFLASHGTGSWESYQDVPISRNADLLFEEVSYQRGVHDPLPDAFDAVSLIAEMVMDYGAYRDLQRHRNCTQFTQLPTIDLGFSVPEDIDAVDLGDKYRGIMEQARDTAALLRSSNVAEGTWLYTIPLAFRHRMLMQMTFKQAAYMIELRSKPQGHISYRRIVAELHNQLQVELPILAKWIRCEDVPGVPNAA